MPRVNLVPESERRRQLQSQAYLVPVVTVGVVAAILGGSYLYYGSRLGNIDEQLAEYERLNQEQAREVQELSGYEALTSQRQSRLNVVTASYNARFRWSRMLDDLSFVVPEDLSLTKVTGKVPGAQVAGKSTAVATARDLEFEGFTRNMPDVAIFMVRLALIPSVYDVSLQLAEVEEVGGERPIHFIINASLRVGDTQRVVAPNTGENGPSRVTPTSPTTTTPRTSPTSGVTSP